MKEYVEQLLVREQWAELLTSLQVHRQYIKQLDLEWLLMYKLKYHLTNDTINQEQIRTVIRLLKEDGIQSNSIPIAILFEDEDRVSQLLLEGHYIDEMLPNEMNGLIVATILQDISLTSYLIARGSNIYHQDNEGQTALDHSRNEMITDLLIQAGGRYKAELFEEQQMAYMANSSWSKAIKSYISSVKALSTPPTQEQKDILFTQCLNKMNTPG
jgi:hypothetical protein